MKKEEIAKNNLSTMLSSTSNKIDDSIVHESVTNTNNQIFTLQSSSLIHLWFIDLLKIQKILRYQYSPSSTSTSMISTLVESINNFEILPKNTLNSSLFSRAKGNRHFL